MTEGSATPPLSHCGAILLILTAVLFAFCPVAASDYAFSDDYSVLSFRPTEDPTVAGQLVHFFSNDGRPLYPIWVVGIMGHRSGVQFLTWVRVLAVVGIFLAAILFFKLVHEFVLENRLEAALVGALFAVNPCFLVVGSWANQGVLGFGFFFGLASIALLFRRERIPVGQEMKRSIFFLGWDAADAVVAGFLLFVAMCIYQPAAMAYWTGATMWIVGRFTLTRQNWLKVIGIGVIFALVSVWYYLTVAAYEDPTSRVHLATDIFRRAVWFVAFPLRTSLYFPFVNAPYAWALVSFGVLTSGLFLYCRQMAKTFWIPVLVAAILPATVLPSLVSYDHYDVLRVKSAIFGVVVLLWGIALRALRGRFAWPLKTWQLLAVALVVATVSDEFCIQRYFVTPLVREESAVQVELLDYVRQNPRLDRPIVLLPPPRDARFAGMKPTDELGLPTTDQAWSSNNLVLQVLAGITHRNFEDMKNVPVLTFYHGERVPPDAFVIDLRNFRPPR